MSFVKTECVFVDPILRITACLKFYFVRLHRLYHLWLSFAKELHWKAFIDQCATIFHFPLHLGQLAKNCVFEQLGHDRGFSWGGLFIGFLQRTVIVYLAEPL